MFLVGAVDLFHHHDRIVDDQRYRGRQSTQCHDVERVSQGMHHHEGKTERDRDRDQQHQAGTPGSQEDDRNHDGQDQPDQKTVANTLDRVLHEVGLHIVWHHGHSCGQESVVQFGDAFLHTIREVNEVAQWLFHDRDEHRRFPIRIDPRVFRLLLDADVGHILQTRDPFTIVRDNQLLELIERFHRGIGHAEVHAVVREQVTVAADEVGTTQRGGDGIRHKAQGIEALRT